MYIIRRGSKGQFHVVTKGDNGEPLSSSEPVKSIQSAMVNFHAQLNAAKTRPGATIRLVIEKAKTTEYWLYEYHYDTYSKQRYTKEAFDKLPHK